MDESRKRTIEWVGGEAAMKRPTNAAADRYLKTTEVRLKTITPLFGGGAEAGEDNEPTKNDPVTAIRPSSVKNHLRLWWRATAGAAITTADELFAREESIWGSTERPSSVDIVVEGPKAPKTKAFDDLNRLQGFDSRVLNYALFPFQKDRSRAAARWLDETEFTLSLRYPKTVSFKMPNSDKDAEKVSIDAEHEILTALRAWLAFGGIGARTRRGCGAMGLAAPGTESVSDGGPLLPAQANLNSIKAWCDQYFFSHIQRSAELRPWTTVSGFILAKDAPAGSVAAWRTSVDLFQFFRQGPNLGRNEGQMKNRPGRSRWPEPESIREATRQRTGKHQRQDEIPADAFPRAELGLPIIFHFKDERAGDPADTMLLPGKRVKNEQSGQEEIVKAGDRMASPLILKPMATSSGQCLPIVMPLRTPQLTEVVLQSSRGRDFEYGEDAIRGKRLADDDSYPMSPLGELSPDGSALRGFLKLAIENDYSVVNIAK